jgi:GNAT superfamily N-acetyltransferase
MALFMSEGSSSMHSARATDSISVQLADRKHLGAIPGIEIAASTLFTEADLPLCLRHKVTEMSHLRAAADDERLWVAVTGQQKPVGFANAAVLDETAYLEELDVLPEFGRQGIGTRLLSSVVNWARDARYPCLLLVTFRHLPWNAPFYNRLGFEIIDSREQGPQIAGLIEEEGRAGIDVSKRVVMRLTF